MLTAESLAELRRLLDECQPGRVIVNDLRPTHNAIWLDSRYDSDDGWGTLRTLAEIDTETETVEVLWGLDDAVLIAAAVNALPALLDAAAERDALAADLDALRAVLAGRCLSDITHRDEEHRQTVCMLPEDHAPLMHDDCMGCTWTDADHWEPSAIDALAEECDGWRHLADVRAARIARVREWIDRRGVDAGDRDDDYMDGYRAAQRHALLDAHDLRLALDADA